MNNTSNIGQQPYSLTPHNYQQMQQAFYHNYPQQPYNHPQQPYPFPQYPPNQQMEFRNQFQVVNRPNFLPRRNHNQPQISLRNGCLRSRVKDLNPAPLKKAKPDKVDRDFSPQISDLDIKDKIRDLRNQIFNWKSCIKVYLPENGSHAEQFPFMQLGIHKAFTTKFVVEKFCIDICFEYDHSIFPNTLAMIYLKHEHKILIKYHYEKLVSINSVENSNGKYTINAQIIVRKQEVLFKDEKECKSVNGRCDGMKEDVIKFAQKLRTLNVLLRDAQNTYAFQTPILCCSGSSFQISLKPYRNEIKKIDELFTFIEKNILPKASLEIINNPVNKINQLAPLVFGSEISKSHPIPFIQNPLIPVVSFSPVVYPLKFPTIGLDCRSSKDEYHEFVKEFIKINECGLDQAAKKCNVDLIEIKKSFLNIIESFFEEDFDLKELPEAMTQMFGTKKPFENIMNLCCLKFFIGFSKDVLKQAELIELKTRKLNWRYPDGYAYIVFGKLNNKFLYFAIENLMYFSDENAYYNKFTQKKSKNSSAIFRAYEVNSDKNISHQLIFDRNLYEGDGFIDPKFFDPTSFKTLNSDWVKEGKDKLEPQIIFGLNSDVPLQAKMNQYKNPFEGIQLGPEEDQLMDLFYPEGEFNYPFPEDPLMVQKVLAQYNEMDNAEKSRESYPGVMHALPVDEEMILAHKSSDRRF